jgi:YfiH family protein
MPNLLFTSRKGGVSRAPFDSLNLALHVGDDPRLVLDNREILAAKIGIRRERIYFMNQVHGSDVAVIESASDPDISPNVDALVTTVPGIVLVTLIADCIPLLLQHESAVAAVHVGRKGLVAGVLESTLNVFKGLGIAINEIKAALGPSICADCYEVSQEMYHEVIKTKPATATTQQRHHLDLAAGLMSDLGNYGIRAVQSEECTSHSDNYFSYRRDGITGRQAGVIWI